MVCSFRLGVESTDYIYTRLITDDDPDEEQSSEDVLSLQAMQLKESQVLPAQILFHLCEVPLQVNRESTNMFAEMVR